MDAEQQQQTAASELWMDGIERRLSALESARGQAGEGEAFKATQYHRADGGLLPCGHYHECLECVDQRELRCNECGSVVNDDTWMCGLCYAHGALKCGHAIEMQRDGGACVECRIEDQLEKVARLAAERDAAARSADERNEKIGYMLDQMSQLAMQLDPMSVVRSEDPLTVLRKTVAQSARLRDAAVRLKERWEKDQALMWNAERSEEMYAAIREIVALVGEEGKT